MKKLYLKALEGSPLQGKLHYDWCILHEIKSVLLISLLTSLFEFFVFIYVKKNNLRI